MTVRRCVTLVAWLLSMTPAITPAVAPATVPAPRPAPDLRVVLGVTHTSGKYHFTDDDYLNEGAARVRELGSRTIKLWFNNVEKAYPYNTTWPKVRSLTELAEAAPFRRVFADDFSTYILVAFSAGMPHGYWKDGGGTPEQFARDEAQFYDLARHLLTTYRGTGKTFVLQSWEGDWLIRPKSDLKIDPAPEAIAGMIAWFNARQRGVDRARAEVGEQGVRVRHAAEVNQVKRSVYDGKRGVIDDVVPHTSVDLVSYSAYDSQQDPAALRACLQHIADRIPPKSGIDGCRVYVGEYGLPETKVGVERVRRTVTQVVDVALDFGCPYVVYWELYCNEPVRTPVVNNDDARGFWLIKPDGSKAWAWEFLQQRIAAGAR